MRCGLCLILHHVLCVLAIDQGTSTECTETPVCEEPGRYTAGGACGPRRVCGVARGWAAPPGLLGQGWTTLASHRYLPMAFYLEIFILNFLEFSGQLHC